jgi:leader peptidase (prepilin peptidase)/N-methyltransferase
MTDPVLVVWYFVLVGGLGLVVGSFLNVLIYRVPAGMSIVRPPSACPTCQTPIEIRDNIPVLSWFLLRGRCRSCSSPISPRYPLVEGSNGVLWLLLARWALDDGNINPLLPLVLVLAAGGVALTFIDLEHHRLPDAIVLPLYPVTAAGLLFAGLVSGEWPWPSALIGLAVWLGLIGALWFFSGGRGMGFGDVKLAPVLGVTLGWVGVGAAAVGLFAAFLVGGVVGVALMIARRAGRRSHLAFGPYLLLGALLGLLVGEPIWNAYLDSFGG